MVLPVVPALVGAIGGTLATSALTKKGDTTTTTTYEPYSTYAPSQANSYNIQYPSYQVQIDSPLASQSTKKEQTAEAASTATPSNSVGAGTDLTPLLPIAAIIAGAYLLGEVMK